MARVKSGSLWRRWLALSPAERRLRREAWWTLLAVALRLGIAPRRLLARAGRSAGAASRQSAAAAREPGDVTPAALAVAIGSAAAHHLRPMTCLPRSLALMRMLERRGIPALLRIGVRMEGTAIAAHAWVEAGGIALGEPEDVEKRFAPLLGFEKEREGEA